jgi:uncharacterized protein involved in outer membrane biogenesis
MKTRLYLRRTAGAAATLVALYTAFGFLAVPALIKSQAERFAAGKLQRQLSIGQVAFNPFTLALSVEAVKMLERQGGAVFASAGRLDVNLSAQSLWRLAPVVQQVRLQQPYVHLVRDQGGHYSIDDILALIAKQPPSPEPARFSINNIEISDGRVVFDDQNARTVHTVEQLRLGVPTLSSMPADVQVFVEPLLAANVNGAPLLLKGKVRPFADPKDMALELKLDDVDLPRYLDYLPFKPAFKATGARLDARLTVSFRQPSRQGPALVIGGDVGLKNLAVDDAAGKPMLTLKSLNVALGSLDVLAGRFDLARVAVDGLDVRVEQDAGGRLNVDQLALGQPAPIAPPAPAPAVTTGKRVTLKQLEIRNSALRYSDGARGAQLEKLSVDLQGLAVDTARKTVNIAAITSNSATVALRQERRAATPPAASAQQDAPYIVHVTKVALQDWSLSVDDRSHADSAAVTFAPLTLALQDASNAPGARMGLTLVAAAGKSGKLALEGKLGFAPLHVDLALDVDKLSLLPLQPYATESVNLRLTQALLTSKGNLKLDAGPAGALLGGFKGNASVDQLATVDKASAADFVSWKALSLGGMDVQLQPFSMNVDKVTLADFFARVIIDPSGRINLQDVRRTHAAGERSLTDAGERADTGPTAVVAVSTAPTPAPAAQALPPIRINTLALSGGRVRFTDNFIRPNYTATLKELGGTISGLSSAPDANAALDLHGVVNSAPLSIAGRINPLKRDLFMDVKAQVRGIELATLSAYADKYVGYGIEKGKLSFEVAYFLDNRQLKSDNRLILDQLTFGNESTNPDATKLPVRLAVALLSDRNGMIDISVPVGGTLDDPQFSASGIILKIIGNAVVKAVTSPFSMLSAAFGGGEEMSTVEFEPGYATISKAGEPRLAALAKALAERPGLKIDVLGRANPGTDTEALKRVAIERKVRNLKTRDLQESGAGLPEGGVIVAQEEYAALLARVFKAETFDKPRNAIGLQKSLTQAEMEQLMIANTEIDNDDLLSLARRRGQAAKDWLANKGLVPVERIYIVAGQGADGGGQGDKPASSRVDFTLR